MDPLGQVPYRSSRPLRVAIAGLGFGEAVHLKALASHPATEPVALWHPRQERLNQACAASGLQGARRSPGGRGGDRHSPWAEI